MFSDQFLLFFWKEYRTQRSIWGICLVIGLLLEFVSHAYFLVPAIAVPMIIPVFYAMACGAMLFAYERETRTSDWLLSLSGNPAPLLGAKLAWAIFSTLLLQVFLAVCEVGFLTTTEERFRADLHVLRMLFVPFALLQLIWVILGSLLSRRSLFSIGATFFWQCILVVAPAGLLMNLSDEGMHAREQGFWFIYVTSHIVVALVDLWLGWRWCQGKYVDGTLLERAQQSLNQWTGERRSLMPLWQRLPRNAEYDRDWKRSWQRLVWQERHRESLHLYLLAIGCLAGPLMIALDVVILQMPIGNPGFKLLTMFGCLVTPCMIGVLAFETDPDQQQLRFLNSRGVNPFPLWLAKQVVWFPRALVITVVIAAVCWLSFFQMAVAMGQGEILRREVMMGRSIVPLISFAFWTIPIGYSCGQLASVFFKRPITAMIIGLVLTLFVDFWTSVAISERTSPTLYLWLIFVSTMLFSELQIRARMSEQPVWRRRLQLLTSSLGITVVAIVSLNLMTR